MLSGVAPYYLDAGGGAQAPPPLPPTGYVQLGEEGGSWHYASVLVPIHIP